MADWLAIEPGRHGVSTEEPTEQYVPFAHRTQSSILDMTASAVLVRMPPGHGTGALAPSTHNRPLVQLLQDVAPDASWYEPAAHKLHVARLSALV